MQNDLVGCHSLSNSIQVVRTVEGDCQVNGGELIGGPFEFCVGDGEADMIPAGSITLANSQGMNSQWIVTDAQGKISLAYHQCREPLILMEQAQVTCLIWHLSYEDGITGLEVDMNANNLEGCFSLSNAIAVVRNQPESGTLEGGPFEFCVGDGVADNVSGITLTGNSGGNSQWIVTDEQGNILGLPPMPGAVDFDGAGPGTCLIWHLSYEDGLTGSRSRYECE